MNYERRFMAATIAAGLVSAHGVDHGGVKADVVADRALAIADAICAKCEEPDAELESGDEIPETDPAALEPLGAALTEPGDAGSQTGSNEGGICLGIEAQGSITPDE
jgi:hypothetical protein